MKNNRGISMITLVITIICMIIFLSLAYSVGTRYITKSKEEEKTALLSVVSTAVERRQNDKHVGLGDAEIFYSGYHISSGDFEVISQSFDTNDFIYEPGLWYIIDAKSASDLGVSNPEQYLVQDLNDSDKGNGKYIAVADYYTGKVFLVYYADVKDNVDNVVDGEGGHVHNTTVATCIEPGVCTECGKIVIPSLGHNFNLSAPTCTEDMKCTRCGYIKEKALGHTYGTEVKYNSEGHFNECIRCSAIGNFEPHKKIIGMIADVNDWRHTVACEKCAYTGFENCTKAVRSKDVNDHIIYCTVCLKEKVVLHDEIHKYRYIDKKEHMVYCDTCKSDLFKEEHVDVEVPYGICDKCNGVMDIAEKPSVLVFTMENSTPKGESKYWAKDGDIVKVNIETTMVLSGTPKLKIQGIEIDEDNIENTDTTKWVATINTSEYGFTDGVMSVELSNLRTVWGVEGSTVISTTDNKYVIYDVTRPEYIFIPE